MNRNVENTIKRTGWNEKPFYGTSNNKLKQ